MTERAERLRERIRNLTWTADEEFEVVVLRAVVEELGIVQGVVETARVHAKLTEAQPGSPNDVMHTALATLLEASGAER